MMSFATRCQLWLRWAAAITVVLLLVSGSPLRAEQKARSHAVHRRTVHRRRTRSRRYHRYRRRYTRIQPERVRQIQQALIKAGVLHESPNGRWDSATRDAMRQYQQENGFSPTGLPEAKPLMKLGLGPHPLPPELAPQPRTVAQSQGDTEATADSTSPPAKKASSSQ